MADDELIRRRIGSPEDDGLIRQLVDRLSAYLVPGHAYDVADELLAARDRARRALSLQALARAGRKQARRGRPYDWAMRDFETRAVGVLQAHGIPTGKAPHKGPAVEIIAAVYAVLAPGIGDVHGEAPAESVRRGVKRANALSRLGQILEETGRPPRLVDRAAPKKRRQPI